MRWEGWRGRRKEGQREKGANTGGEEAENLVICFTPISSLE